MSHYHLSVLFYVQNLPTRNPFTKGANPSLRSKQSVHLVFGAVPPRQATRPLLSMSTHSPRTAGMCTRFETRSLNSTTCKGQHNTKVNYNLLYISKKDTIYIYHAPRARRSINNLTMSVKTTDAVNISRRRQNICPANAYIP
jgi:hypothetical protein